MKSGILKSIMTGFYLLFASIITVSSQTILTSDSTLFENVTISSGTGDNGQSWGGAWGDFDKDGDLDLFVATYSGPCRLFRNEGNETFSEVAGLVGLQGNNAMSLGAIWADFDNDYDLDLFVSVTQSENVLYRNESGIFFDIGKSAGVIQNDNTVSVDWADYDKDGDLDLFIPNWNTPNRLYQNKLNGFIDIAPNVGINESGACRAAIWGDYDNDGDFDLYVCRGGGSDNLLDLLYRNDDGIFINVSNSVGLNAVLYTRAAAWGDYDNDGDIDLFAATVEDQPNKLYRNDNGNFIDVSTLKGVDASQGGSQSISWVDPDNDGDLDIFITRAAGFPNLFYENVNGNFIEAQVKFGLNDNNGSRLGNCWGDFNSDGFLDLYVTNRDGANYLYKNKGNLNNWIAIDLNGSISNSYGIGAKIKVECGELTQVKEVYCGSGQVSQHSITTEFGLGLNTSIDLISVFWPSGKVQRLSNLKSNQFLTIYEEGSTNEDIFVFIDEVKSFSNDSISVPVNIDLEKNATISSLEFSFTGFQDEIEFIGVNQDSGLLGEADWLIEWNDTDSVLTIVAAGSKDIIEPGLLFELEFFIPDSISPKFIPIHFKNAIFNNDEISTNIDSGGIEILEPMFGDVDLNNSIRAFDASVLLKYLVGIYDLNRPQMLNADVSLDSSISSLDATLILKYVAGLIDSLPYLDSDSLLSLGYAEIVMNDVFTDNESLVELPIYLNNYENIYSFQGEITYNENHLNFNDITLSSDLENFILEKNVYDGVLKFSGASNKKLKTNGLFVNVKFKLNENFINDTTKVKFKQVRWNEGEIESDLEIANIVRTVSIVKQTNNNIPGQFSLFQNYPNPFNPITTIEYSVASLSNISIAVYNSSGQLVEILVDKESAPGLYSVQWDASNFSSGLYIYKFKAASIIRLKKMLYLK